MKDIDIQYVSFFALFVDKNIVNYDCYKKKTRDGRDVEYKFLREKQTFIHVYKTDLCLNMVENAISY